MVIELLQQLVGIPSINPMGISRTGSEFLETGVSTFLLDWFRSRGISCEYREIVAGRGNVIARLNGPSGAPTIALDAHQDTVPIDGMSVAPFAAEILNGRIYGRGACDVKGGMAAMLTAFAQMAQSPPVTVVMACTCDEELGQSGVRDLTASWRPGGNTYELLPDPPDYVIVAEPTELNVVTAHKGTIRWCISTKGVAVHSSNPTMGENAVYHMAELVQHIRQYADELATRVPEDADCGKATLSIGVIRGGVSVNIVPDRCEIEVDRRLLPGETPDAAEQDLQDWLTQRNTPPFAMTRIGCTGYPLKPTDRSTQLTAQLLSIVQRCSPAATSIGVPFCTHASTYAQAGVPAVVFGPGSIHQAHAADEWIETDQVTNAARTLQEFLTTCSLPGQTR